LTRAYTLASNGNQSDTFDLLNPTGVFHSPAQRFSRQGSRKLSDHGELKAVTFAVHFSADRHEIYRGVPFDSQVPEGSARPGLSALVEGHRQSTNLSHLFSHFSHPTASSYLINGGSNL